MNELDQMDIRADEVGGDSEAGRSPRRSSNALWLVLAGVLLVAAGLTAWWWWPGRDATPGVQTAAGLPASSGQPSDTWKSVEEEIPVDPDLPALEESDTLARQLVGALSSHPNLVAWLANDNLVDLFTRSVTNVAFDEDPRGHVPFLRPSGKFSVGPGEEGTIVIAPASYARYDLVCDVVTSVDTQGAVAVYRKLLPLFQSSYQELGMPGDFRDALRRAIARVLDTPTLPGEIALQEETLAYRYADPRLEALAPAQKLLLRTGSRNVARVKAKVREIADAADLL